MENLELVEKKESGFKKVIKIAAIVHLAALAVAGAVKFYWRRKEKASEDKTIKEYYALWEDKRIHSNDDEFSGMTIQSVQSAVTVDLTDADFIEESFVSVKSVMSAVVIIVPENVKVIVDGRNSASAIEDKCDHSLDDQKTKVLYVAYDCKMSAICVQNPKEE